MSDNHKVDREYKNNVFCDLFSEKSNAPSLYNALNRCIQENHLKSYLLKKKAEVSLMLLTEFNQEAFARVIRNEGVEEGIEIGVEMGEDCVNQLHSYLISDKRFDDLTRATKDKQYQAQLYKEYGL